VLAVAAVLAGCGEPASLASSCGEAEQLLGELRERVGTVDRTDQSEVRQFAGDFADDLEAIAEDGDDETREVFLPLSEQMRLIEAEGNEGAQADEPMDNFLARCNLSAE
jgi:hypothetical protein